MICVLAFCQKDAGDARSLLEWIKTLGGCPRHDIICVADAGTSWGLALDVLTAANAAFRTAQIISNDRAIDGWIEGSNDLFLTAALHIEEKVKQPWLWLESDGIPLKKDWLDVIDTVYEQGQKPFMGWRYMFSNPDNAIAPFPLLSGVAVYPPNAWSRLIKSIRFAPNQAFDVSCAPIIMPEANHTNLIQHFYGEKLLPPTFSESKLDSSPVNTWTLQQLHPNAVLFHRNKDGSLIRLLKRKLFPPLKADFVSLRRAGDIIALLPLLYNLYQQKPVVQRLVVAKEFVSLLEGVSYIDAVPWDGDWEGPLAAARQFNATNLQVFGKGLKPNMSRENFAKAAWSKLGYRWNRHLPLVFDRRNDERETALVNRVFKTDKPKILIKLQGTSSPFSDAQFVTNEVNRLFGNVAEIVSLDAVKAERLYDMLGLFDCAACLITVDTYALWLAHASPVPCIQFVNGRGWSASPARGNCLLRLPYGEVTRQWQRVASVLQTVLTPKGRDEKVLVFSDWKPTDPDTKRRNDAAYSTWNILGIRLLPFVGNRNSIRVGDKRAMPFVRDMLDAAFAGGENIAIIINNDIQVDLRLSAAIERSCAEVGCWWSYRLDKPGGKTDQGADLFAMTRQWWMMHRHLYPDFLLGYWWWDDVMVRLMRWSGCPERERLYYHEPHPAATVTRGGTPGMLHNERLALAWLAEHDELREKP
jgi:hypothetical protein